MLRYALFALPFLGILMPSAAMAEQFILACHYVPKLALNGAVFDTNYSVDVDKGTVNGNPATIRSDMIQYKYQDEFNYEIRINRLTGHVDALADSQLVASGHCEIATPRKF